MDIEKLRFSSLIITWISFNFVATILKKNLCLKRRREKVHLIGNGQYRKGYYPKCLSICLSVRSSVRPTYNKGNYQRMSVRMFVRPFCGNAIWIYVNKFLCIFPRPISPFLLCFRKIRSSVTRNLQEGGLAPITEKE